MAKPILPSPGSNANEAPAPSPWTRQEIPAGGYPGALPNTRDPRDNSADLGLDKPEAYPGSGVPGEPLARVPAPAPRRIRRDA